MLILNLSYIILVFLNYQHMLINHYKIKQILLGNQNHGFTLHAKCKFYFLQT